MEPADIRATTRHEHHDSITTTTTTTTMTSLAAFRLLAATHSCTVSCLTSKRSARNRKIIASRSTERAPRASAARHEPELRRSPGRAAPSAPLLTPRPLIGRTATGSRSFGRYRDGPSHSDGVNVGVRMQYNSTDEANMTPSIYVSRINQIDAAALDTEIYKVLKNQAKEIARYGAPGKIDKWQAEIDVLLKFFIWHFSLQGGSSTFGQKLLNLHYGNINRRKAVLYLILSVLPQYLRDKLTNERPITDNVIGRGLRSLADWTSNAVALLEFVNLLLFLHRGVQPRVIELLLDLSSQSITTHRPRSIGYSYMARELLWHGLMELFIVGIPMINFHYLKHTIKRLRRRKDHTRDRSTVLPVMDAETRCAYCNETPILPTHAGCEHMFCYYCLQAHFTATSVFHCPRCNAELHSDDAKRYAPASAVPSDDDSDDGFEKVDSG